MKNDQSIARLLQDVEDEQGAIKAVSGDTPLTTREQALVAATRIFWTNKLQKPRVEGHEPRQFDHTSTNIYEACGLNEEESQPKVRQVAAWMASENILRDCPVKKSQVIEKILEISDNILECVVIAKQV